MSRIYRALICMHKHTHLASTTNNGKSFYSHLYYAKLSSLILSNPNPSMYGSTIECCAATSFLRLFCYYYLLNSLYARFSAWIIFIMLFRRICATPPHVTAKPFTEYTNQIYIHTEHIPYAYRRQCSHSSYMMATLCSVVDDCVVWIWLLLLLSWLYTERK